MRFIVDPFDGFLIALHTPDTTTEERRFLAQHPTALDDIQLTILVEGCVSDRRRVERAQELWNHKTLTSK